MNQETKKFNAEFAAQKAVVLVRDRFKCQGPDGHNCFGPLTVDHIRKRSLGGSNSLKNLITLCSGYHSEVEDLPSSEKEELLFSLLGFKYEYTY